MTSKISFLKYTKNEIHRRVWLIMLLGILFFLFQPVAGLLKLGEEQTDLNHVYLFESMVQYLVNGNGLVTGITGIGAVLAGFTGFSFVYSRKKLDLFHSLPIRRERLFAQQIVSNYLLFLLPYFCCQLLLFLIVIVQKGFHMEFLQAVLLGFVMQNLLFWFVHMVTLVAIMLTGKLLAGFLALGTITGYTIGLAFIIQLYMSAFFETSKTITPWLERVFITILSPIGLLAEKGFLENLFYEGSWHGMGALGKWICVIIVETLLFAGVSLYLYRIRKTEAAERTIAFPKMESIVKFLLVVPGALLSGQFFCMLSVNNSVYWLIFGLIFGVLVLSCLLEIIFSYDFRKALNRKWQLVGSLAVVFAVLLVFRFDLFGYDRWIPDQDRVESMAISINDENVYVEYPEYLSAEQYRLQNMELTDFEPVYAVAEHGVSNIHKKDENLSEITIQYRMKNGQKITRYYRIDKEVVAEPLKKIKQDPGYQNAVYPILTVNTDQEMQLFMETMIFSGKELDELSKEKKKELIQTFCKEIREGAEQDCGVPVGAMRLESKENFYTRQYIYSGYKETIRILKEAGCDLSRKPDPSAVTSMYIEDYGKTEKDNADIQRTKNVITDSDEQKELLEAACWYDEQTGVIEGSGILLQVLFVNDSGYEEWKTYIIPEAHIPDSFK